MDLPVRWARQVGVLILFSMQLSCASKGPPPIPGVPVQQWEESDDGKTIVCLRNDLEEPIRIKAYSLTDCENVLGRCNEEITWKIAVRPEQTVTKKVQSLDWTKPARFRFGYEWDKNLDDAWSPDVRGREKPPRLIRRVTPVFPEGETVGGTVGVEFVVSRNGRVEEVVITNPVSPAIDAAVIAAVRQWEFRPGEVNGEKVRSTLAVPFTFTPPKE